MRLFSKNKKHISNSALALWYEALLVRCTSLSDTNNALDSKTNALAAASAALIVFVLGKNINNQCMKIIILAAVVGLAASIICSLASIWVVSANSSVNTTQDYPEYYYKNDDEFIWQMIADLEHSLNGLLRINERKGRLYTWAVGLFGLSSSALITVYIVEWFSK